MRRPVTRLLTVLTITLLLHTTLAPLTPLQAQDDTPDTPAVNHAEPQGDFRVVLREDFIVEQIETQILPYIEGFSAGDIYVEDPALNLRPDNIIDLSATTELTMGDTPLTLRPTISLHVIATDNELTVSIDTVSLEGVQFPAALLAAQIEPVQVLAQEQINNGLEQVAQLAGLELVYIETTEDLLILDFNFSLLFYSDPNNPEPTNSDPNNSDPNN